MSKTISHDIFEEIDMQIFTLVLKNKGSSANVNLKKMGMSTEFYNRRHYLVSGSADVICKNSVMNKLMSPMKGMPGDIFPDYKFDTIKNMNLVNSFDFISTDDDTGYICFIPCNENNLIKHESFSVVSGNIFEFKKGNVYIATFDLTIDKEVIKAHTPIPVINNDREIAINSDGKIRRFYSTGNV